jgi:hypothetical protein
MSQFLAILFRNTATCWLVQAKNIGQALQLLETALAFLRTLYNADSCLFTQLRLVVLMRNTGNAFARALEMAGQVQEAASLKEPFLAQLDRVAEDLAASELFSCTINAASRAA